MSDSLGTRNERMRLIYNRLTQIGRHIQADFLAAMSGPMPFSHQSIQHYVENDGSVVVVLRITPSDDGLQMEKGSMEWFARNSHLLGARE